MPKHKLTVIAILVLIVCITTFACGKTKPNFSSVIAQDTRTILTINGISLRAFDAIGAPIVNPSKTFTLTVEPNSSGRRVQVATKSEILSPSCYLELRFDPNREHPTNLQTSSTLQEYQPLVYTGCPEAGIIIAAMVIPELKPVRFSGEVFSFQLDAGKHTVRRSSGFEQNPYTDPIITNPYVDETDPDLFYWTMNLRGDGNNNLVFDFADFGVIGAKYNKSSSDNGCEVADANNNGKIDFADFGVIGANYNKGVGGLKVWRDDNSQPSTLLGVLSLSSKLKGNFSHNPENSKILNNGFKQYWHKISGTGNNFKLELLDLTGKEITGHSKNFSNNNIKSGPGEWWMFGRDAQHTRNSTLPGPINTYYVTEKATGAAIYSSPAVSSDGTIYIGCDDSNLYAFNYNGVLRWTFATESKINNSSPAVGADGTVYIGSGSKLYAIYPNGTLKWTFNTGDTILTSPAIGTDGTIYFGSNDKCIYALNSAGKTKWKVETTASVKSSPAIAPNGTIYCGSSNGQLYAINNDGTIKWTFHTAAPIVSSPSVGSNNVVYFGSGDTYLYAVDQNGKELWKFQTGDKIESSPALGKFDVVYIASKDKKLYAISPLGDELWKLTLEDYLAGSPAIDAEGTLYLGLVSGKVLSVSNAGGVVWSYLANGPIYSSIAICNKNTIAFGTENKKFYLIKSSDPTSNNPPRNLSLKTEGNLVIATWEDPDKDDEWYVSWNKQPAKKVTIPYDEYYLPEPTSLGPINVTCEVLDKKGIEPLSASVQLLYQKPIGTNVIGFRAVPLTSDGQLRVGDLLLVEFCVSQPEIPISQFNVISLGTTAGAFVPATKTDKAFGVAVHPTVIGGRSDYQEGFTICDPKSLVAVEDNDYPGIWQGFENLMLNNMNLVWKYTPYFENIDAVECFIAKDYNGGGSFGKFPTEKMDIFREIGVNSLGLSNSTTKSGWICSIVLKAAQAGKVTLGIIVDKDLNYTYYNDKDGNNIFIKPTPFIELTILNPPTTSSWQQRVANSISSLTQTVSRFNQNLWDRALSALKQTQSDPVVQNLTYDPGTKTLKWTNVFRCDCDTNDRIDFTDFGIIGKKYNKAVKDDPSCEVADANNIGRVDFADFGVVGNYYKTFLVNWSFWYSDSPFTGTPTTAPSGTLKIDDKAFSYSVGARGFKEVTISIDQLPNYKSQQYIFIAPSDGNVDYPLAGASVSTK